MYGQFRMTNPGRRGHKGDQSLLHFKGSQTTSDMTGKVKVHTEHTMIFIHLEQ